VNIFSSKKDFVQTAYTDEMNTGESRTDLVGRNIKILSSAIEDMKPFRDDTIIILVTNPVDILTYFAQKLSGLPKNQVIGSGTFLDSARLRGILSQKCGVAASSIEAYVLGEHGDSQMVTSSYHSGFLLPTNNNNRSHGHTHQSAESPSTRPSRTPQSTKAPLQTTRRKRPPPSPTPKAQPLSVSAA
jgi:malate/lactate dehydrogenase